jgi:hypothetical protein
MKKPVKSSLPPILIKVQAEIETSLTFLNIWVDEKKARGEAFPMINFGDLTPDFLEMALSEHWLKTHKVATHLVLGAGLALQLPELLERFGSAGSLEPNLTAFNLGFCGKLYSMDVFAECESHKIPDNLMYLGTPGVGVQGHFYFVEGAYKEELVPDLNLTLSEKVQWVRSSKVGHRPDFNIQGTTTGRISCEESANA